MTPTPDLTSPTIERLVRHKFTPDERNSMGDELAIANGTLRHVDAEFKHVAAGYKTRAAEVETKIDKLSTDLVNGFDMRVQEVVVVFNPKLRRKFFYLLDDLTNPVDEADMMPEDFQTDLFQAEVKFELKEEIQLFPPAGNDRGVLVVGRIGENWFSALRVRIGGRTLKERLDSDQPSTKNRWDRITTTNDRYIRWVQDALGKEVAKGFEGPAQAAIESHKERVE